MNSIKILKNNDILYKYDTNFFFTKLNNFEIDINLNELIYNIFYYPYNIDKWVSKNIYEYINFNKQFNIKKQNDLLNLNLDDNLLSLHHIRNFIFSNLNKKIEFFSKNNNISYIFIYENKRVKIFNVEHNENKIICENITKQIDEKINKHLLLHYILNPFWILKESKNYYDINRTNIKLQNDNIIILYDKNNIQTIIKNPNVLSCIIDNYNINFENCFIKNIINKYFNIKPINFDKFDKTIMTILFHSNIDIQAKEIIWKNYTQVYKLMLTKKNVVWNILKHKIIINDNYNDDISIYNLDEKIIKKIKLLNLNGNDLFLIIPYIYKNENVLNILPYFIVKKKELPYCIIREKIINSFFDNSYNGKKYISHYGFNYIIKNIDTKIKDLKYNSNFIITEKMYFLSKEIENCSKKKLDLFVILSNNNNQILNYKKLNDIIDNNKFCFKLKALVLIILYENSIYINNKEILQYFNDNISILIKSLKNGILLTNYTFNYRKFEYRIENNYKKINQFEIISQYLTNNRISLENKDNNLYNNISKVKCISEFINCNIFKANFSIFNKKLLIENIIWKENINSIFDLIIEYNKIIYFKNFNKLVINFNNLSYMYIKNEIYFKQLLNEVNNIIYIETNFSDEYLSCLLSLKLKN